MTDHLSGFHTDVSAAMRLSFRCKKIKPAMCLHPRPVHYHWTARTYENNHRGVVRCCWKLDKKVYSGYEVNMWEDPWIPTTPARSARPLLPVRSQITSSDMGII
ncbi:hypothetical protein YC2023_109538 [Brassica napus]